MPRPKSPPTYCIHGRSQRAYTTVDGQQIQLGPANSPESRAAFDRILGEWYANGRQLPTASDCRGFSGRSRETGPSVTMLIEGFWRHAQGYYTEPERDAAGQPVINPDGTPRLIPSRELESYRHVLRPLRRLYGADPAAGFNCAHLEALRAAMIRPQTDPDTGVVTPGWCRTYCNRQVSRIKSVFAWGVTKGMVPVTTYQTLMLLPGLRAGHTTAREPDPVLPVDESRAMAILPFVSRQVAAMVQLQLACGFRSTEVCIMRPRDIDRTGKTWTYSPSFHKTQGKGIKRAPIPIGPRLRAVLAPFLDRELDAFCFSPAEAEAERKEKLREARKTKVQPSQAKRSQDAAKRNRKRPPADRYNRSSYHRAVRYGCEAAFSMPKDLKRLPSDTAEQLRAKTPLRKKWFKEFGWHPHQARHRAATALRKAGGLDAAKTALGHTHAAMTEHYAQADVEKLNETMELIG